MRLGPIALATLLSVAAIAASTLATCGDDDDATTPAAIPKATVAATLPATSGATASASPTITGSLLEVEISDNKFTPSNLSVPTGSKVTWVWTGQRTHSVEGTFNGQAVASEK